MNKMKTLALSVILLAGLAMPVAAGQPPQLKGIHLGMTKQEYGTITGYEGVGYHNFHLADVRGKAYPMFENGLLVHWFMSFESNTYEKMRDSLKTKYELSCELSEVRTRAGLEYVQEECTFEVGDTTLEIERYSEIIREGTVRISSRSHWRQKVAEGEQRSREDL